MRKTWLTTGSGCENDSTRKVENIERIFLNDGVPIKRLSLTFFTRSQDGGLDISHGWFEISSSKILTDVPEDKSMWATVTQLEAGGFFSDDPGYAIELHIRSGKDIEGGTWSHTDQGPPYAVHSGKVQAVA